MKTLVKNPKFVIRKDRGTLQLNYSNKQKLFRVDSGIKTTAENWDEVNQRIKGNDKQTVQDNITLQSMLNRLKQIITDYKYKTGEKPSTEFVFKEYFKEHNEIVKQKELYSCYSEWFEQKKSLIKDARHFKTILIILEKYKGYYTLDEINESFKNKLVNEWLKKGLNNYTIQSRLKCFKVFMNDMNKQSKTDNINHKNWINKDYSIPEKPVVCLTEVELYKLIEYQFPEIVKWIDKNGTIQNIKGNTLSYYRDLYVLGSSTGLRWSDLIRLKENNIISVNGNKFISMIINKTGKTIRIPLNEISESILEKYNYKILYRSNQKINEHLKIIFKEIGINDLVDLSFRSGNKVVNKSVPRYELLSFHSSRRTFVTLLISQGVTPDSIRKWTGHRSLEVFYNYVNAGTTEMEQMQRVLRKK